ncbi:hypothetical protein [Alicyclobacillus fructus]|uniref:hypothetical protein n=1 Tax=Alicyclobacillus fructus TaxID=2816082 RepID=UPI001A8C534D|nr:hypothetical protein [Alicyclobacillus fructus]
MRIRAVYVWDARRERLLPVSEAEKQVTERVIAVSRPLVERMLAHRGRRVTPE